MIQVCLPYYSEYEMAKPGLIELDKSVDPKFRIVVGEGYDAGIARNRMVAGGTQKKKQELTKDISHYLFVDSDIGFTLAHVKALVAHNKDIVSGSAIRRDIVTDFNAGWWEEGYPGNSAKSITVDDERILHKVDYVGAGFVLVRREVLEAMEFPWFRHIMIEKEDNQDEVAEDYSFCIGATNAGFEIFIDCAVRVQHRLSKLTLTAPAPNLDPELLQMHELLSRLSTKLKQNPGGSIGK